MKNDMYQEITNRIINQLEKGVVPWKRPWKGGSSGLPHNLATSKHYRGINILLLLAEGYDSPHWMTFRQARQLGGHVRKGVRGTKIVFWKFLEKEDEEGKSKKIPMARSYTVFNLEQCEELCQAPAEQKNQLLGQEAAQALVDSWKGKPEIHHGGGRAYYDPTHDLVQVPNSIRFGEANEYYSTLFHELAHSTGHVSRLNREEVTNPKKFGSHTYSREELVAEMGSAFLCAHSGIDNTLQNSASYIKHWLKKLRNDKRLLLSAASKAQRAADHISGFMPTTYHTEKTTNKHASSYLS